MPTYSLKRFAHGEALAAIEPLLLLRLLSPHREYFAGRSVRLPDADEPPVLDYAALLGVLLVPDVDTPRGLTDAMYYIHEMATPEGVDALLEAVSLEELGLGGSRGGAFFNPAPGDVALRVWLHDPELLQRKHAEQYMRRYRSFLYYRARRRPPPPYRAPPAEVLAEMEACMDDRFLKKNRGGGARVFAFPQDDGTAWFLVRHGDPYRREGTMTLGEPSSVVYRPLRFDVVVYDGATGDLRIHAQTRWEAVLYREQFGLRLFGDMQFFSASAKYTLEPLRAQGAESLRCDDVEGIKYVLLREVHLQWGGAQKEVQIHKAQNVFEALGQRKGQMPLPPRLTRASFGVRFDDSAHLRTVTIVPPNTAMYLRDEDAAVAEPWLRARGFVRDGSGTSRAEEGEPGGEKNSLFLEIA